MTDANTAPAPKPGILDIAPYVGGKGAIAGFAEPMKLSSNENALGAGQKAREAYAAALKNIHVYPDGRATKLREAVAAHHGLEAERLIFGNGSDEVFALLNQTYLQPGDNIVTGQYGFLAYRISAKACGAEVKLAAEPNMKAEVEAILEQVDERTKIVYVSNPSNPTGSWNSGEEIRRLHAAPPAHIILVVDEAYAEFVVEPEWESSFGLAREASNIVVTRTFSKIHGLGGLRIGFGYAPLAIEQAVDRIRLPFNVTRAGQAAAVAALGDEEFVANSREHNAKWRGWLAQELESLGNHGVRVVPSACNFLLVLFEGDVSAETVYNRLMDAGYIVRWLPGQGLPGALRMTIGTEEETRGLAAAIRTALNG